MDELIQQVFCEYFKTYHSDLEEFSVENYEYFAAGYKAAVKTLMRATLEDLLTHES